MRSLWDQSGCLIESGCMVKSIKCRDAMATMSLTGSWPYVMPLRWRHNEHDGVLNHQPYHCLLNRLFRRRSKKTSKLRVIGLCAGNSTMTGEFPAQMASNAENVSILWSHYVGLAMDVDCSCVMGHQQNLWKNEARPSIKNHITNLFMKV